MDNERVDSRGIISDYIFFSKYSRVKPDGKKETWDESVTRVMQMHMDYFDGKIKPENKEAFSKVFNEAWSAYSQKKILGSQRALQFGGEQMLKKHTKCFNCAGSYLNRIEFFEEAAYLLLSGCGVGISVQKHHTDMLPVMVGINRELLPTSYTIPDSIEGWAKAFGMLIQAHYNGGSQIHFSYSDIRPEGAFISGGFKAPGPEPLRIALEKIDSILKKIKERKLTSFELHYITCIIANAVVAGGVRRSAMICLFDAWDEEMLSCKTGNWFQTYPELCRCNNSACIYPDTPKETYLEIFKQIKDFGEPGIIFLEDKDSMFNPCCFTGETLVGVADGRNAVTIKQLSEEGLSIPIYYKNKRGRVLIAEGTAFCTGTKEVIEVVLSNGSSFRCTPDHPLQTSMGDYVNAEDSKGIELSKFFSSQKKYRTINSFTDGHSRQYRKIWEYANGEKPEGYEIDHLENNDNDSLENLQLISLEDHLKKTSEERMGRNNPIYKVDPEVRSSAAKANSTMEGNGRYKGLSNEELIAIGKQALASGKTPNQVNCAHIDSRFPLGFSKNRFGGSLKLFQKYVYGELEYQDFERPTHLPKEKKDLSYLAEGVYVVDLIDNGELEEVYDIEMSCEEHNFAIITKGDSNYGNSEGVFVHNCEAHLYPKFVNSDSSVEYGFSFCNLCEINGALVKTEQDFYKACRTAAILGTFQAAYTKFQVLSPASQKIAERDALLGVGITGMADVPSILFNEDIQRKGAQIVKETNEEVAAILGINFAARTTVVKPSGNASQLLGCASGIHAYHFRKYIRNIQAAETEQSWKEFEKTNPGLISNSFWNPDREKVLSFPIHLPEEAMVRTDQSTLDFLRRIYSTQLNWIMEGTNRKHPSSIEKPHLHHNVSCTVSVKDNEWNEIANWIWENREGFCGLSFLPETGDLDYPQAPYSSYLDEKELSETYGPGAILSSGLIVDGLNVFNDIWTACNAANGRTDNLLKYTDDYLLSYIKKHLKDGKLLVEIDGIYVSDLNAISAHLQHKVDLRVDWVRRFKKFAKQYFDGDEIKCANCLKHVNIFHQWQKLTDLKAPVWEDVEWEQEFKQAGEQVGNSCAGGKCEI